MCEELIPEQMTIHNPDRKLLKIINGKKYNDKVLFEIESNFHSIKVVENEVGRFLHYANTYQAGFINTEFYKGNLPYINYFLIPYLINPEIEKILLIGFGSGKLVNDYEFLFKKLKSIDVVDIDENITEIAKKYFDFKQTEKFNFILQDGITYLRTTRKKYDLIVVDVANNNGIELRFLTDYYFESIKKCLKKSGIFVSNMCASPDFEHSDNVFFRDYFPIYKRYFKYNLVFKGDYSDRVYYKSFFDIDERVVDITNVIIISTDRNAQITDNKELKKNIQKLNVYIDNYLNDKSENI